MSSNDFDIIVNELIKLSLLPENRQCADCGAKNPRWCSWNLGIFVCMRCAGLHRKLGVGISKVKSITLDKWTESQIKWLRAIGNKASNQYYERNMPSELAKPKDDFSHEKFIFNKYQHKSFALKDQPTPNQLVDSGSTNLTVEAKPSNANSLIDIFNNTPTTQNNNSLYSAQISQQPQALPQFQQQQQQTLPPFQQQQQQTLPQFTGQLLPSATQTGSTFGSINMPTNNAFNVIQPTSSNSNSLTQSNNATASNVAQSSGNSSIHNDILSLYSQPTNVANFSYQYSSPQMASNQFSPLTQSFQQTGYGQPAQFQQFGQNTPSQQSQQNNSSTTLKTDKDYFNPFK